MYQPRQPGRNAHFVLTQDAGPEFDLFTSNVAVEPADAPGMVRVYRRTSPSGTWRQGSQMLNSQALVMYGAPLRPDSSD